MDCRMTADIAATHSSQASGAGQAPPRAASRRAAASGSTGATATTTVSQAAEQCKDAGNAMFKQQRYGAAAEQYRRGVQALQASASRAGGSAGAPASRKQQLDLLNNLGLALIRQAEAEPAGEEGPCWQRQEHDSADV